MLAETTMLDKHYDEDSDGEEGDDDDDDNTDQDVGDARVLHDSIVVVTRHCCLSNCLIV